MATKMKNGTLKKLIDSAPRVKPILERSDYVGTCIVQAPGAWTRYGPTWHDERLGWICAGPGVASWGTTEGLAQLAGPTAGKAKPSWHATGICAVPTPNVVFFAIEEALDAPIMELVRALAEEADEIVKP